MPATWIFTVKHPASQLQPLDNKLDDTCATISFQRDIRNYNVLCFAETWLNLGIPNGGIQPGDYFPVRWTDRSVEFGEEKEGGVCFMVNKEGQWEY